MTDSSTSPSTEQQLVLQQANRIIVALALVALALGMVCVYLWYQRPLAGLELEALRDPEIRRQVVTYLAAENPGFYDTHVDADIGRTMLADLEDFDAKGLIVSTNRFGMRERDYEMPKPPGTVRIVLLGDSFVFGIGVAEKDRMGVFLEEDLERLSPYEGEIEVLHLGVASWNFINEAAFLRRQLSELQPDVVLQLSLPNDIEDGVGARGVGVWARFSPQLPRRADSVLDAGYPLATLGYRLSGYVRHGIDYEGQQRYADSVARLTHLQDEIEAAGGGYRLILHYRQLLRPGWKYLGRHMSPGTMYYISKDFGNDRKYWVDRTDHHWNRHGHRRFSRVLYEILRRDGLVPELKLPQWDKASQEYQAIAEHGRGEAEQSAQSEQELLDMLSAPAIASAIDFRQLDDATAAQVHTGIDTDRLVSPYASFVLSNPGAQRLRVRGRTLERPEIDGAKVEVFIDGERVGVVEIKAGTELDLEWPVPDVVAERPFLSIRFQSDDYVYQGTDYQHCVVFQLDSIALEVDGTS